MFGCYQRCVIWIRLETMFNQYFREIFDLLLLRRQNHRWNLSTLYWTRQFRHKKGQSSAKNNSTKFRHKNEKCFIDFFPSPSSSSFNNNWWAAFSHLFEFLKLFTQKSPSTYSATNFIVFKWKFSTSDGSFQLYQPPSCTHVWTEYTFFVCFPFPFFSRQHTHFGRSASCI